MTYLVFLTCVCLLIYVVWLHVKFHRLFSYLDKRLTQTRWAVKTLIEEDHNELRDRISTIEDERKSVDEWWDEDVVQDEREEE